MKKLFFILFFSSFLFADCLPDDQKCNKDLALKLKWAPDTEEKAAEIFLDLSLKGDVDATRELGLLYIYGKKIPRDCQKGVYILLNSVKGGSGKQSVIAYNDIANLFRDGICLEKNAKKEKKYRDLYMSKVKEKMKEQK